MKRSLKLGSYLLSYLFKIIETHKYLVRSCKRKLISKRLFKLLFDKNKIVRIEDVPFKYIKQ